MKEKLKVNLSIFELLLRNGGLKLAAVILLTMLAEGVLVYMMMQKETLYYENLFARGAAIPLMAGFILLSLAMLNPMKASKSNLNYTLKRLRVKPVGIFAAEVVYLMLAYAYFAQNLSEALNREAGLFLAFGRTHDLWLWLPIGNAALAVRNTVGIAALSAAAARFNCFLRKGETKAIAPLLTLVLFTRVFYTDISDTNINLVRIAMLLGMLLFCVVSTCFEEAEL